MRKGTGRSKPLNSDANNRDLTTQAYMNLKFIKFIKISVKEPSSGQSRAGMTASQLSGSQAPSIFLLWFI